MTTRPTRRTAAAALATGFLGLADTAAPADDTPAPAPAGEGRPDDEEVSPTYQAAQDVVTATYLIEYGRRTRSPEALLAAAIIIARTPVQPVSDAGGGKEEPGSPEDPTSLLEEARKLRPNDKSLGEVLAKAADDLKESSRTVNNKSGVYEWSRTLKKGEASTISLAMKAGLAQFSVSHPVQFGPGMATKKKQPLKIEVLGAKDNVVAKDSGTGLAHITRYTVPKPGGTYKVRVTNSGTETVTVKAHAG